MAIHKKLILLIAAAGLEAINKACYYNYIEYDLLRLFLKRSYEAIAPDSDRINHETG